MHLLARADYVPRQRRLDKNLRLIQLGKYINYAQAAECVGEVTGHVRSRNDREQEVVKARKGLEDY